MGHINQEVFISAVMDEPKIKWLLLEGNEWNVYRSNLVLQDTNTIEHAGEKDLLEWENTHNVFVKETLKNKELLQQYPETEPTIRKLGWTDFDNVIIMSAERTEEVFKRMEESQVQYFGKPFYYNVDCCRLAFFIHELIHSYEFRFGKPIIQDTIDTESVLQNEILFRYFNARLMQPKDFTLSYSQ